MAVHMLCLCYLYIKPLRLLTIGHQPQQGLLYVSDQQWLPCIGL